jgi:hypothetical protein
MWSDKIKMSADRDKITGSKTQKWLIKGRKFELRLVCNNKSKAKCEASKWRKRDFHTRVIETPPGIFSVYSRPKVNAKSMSSNDKNSHSS